MQTRIETPGVDLDAPDDITLFSTAGRVRSLAGFVEDHGSELPALEADLVQRWLPLIPEPAEPRLPVALARGATSDGRLELPARRSGARSALLPHIGMKLKACRPEASEFPRWVLNNDFTLEVQRVPFGVLDAEGVMRELLAAGFHRAHGLPVVTAPVAVIEYEREEGTSFSLIARYVVEERLESRLDAARLTLHQLIRLRRSGTNDGILGGEVRLRGMDARDYVRAKTRLLALMNFAGGFRGVLNSNIGNDVVEGGGLVALCDFDTFRVSSVPSADDAAGVRRFVMTAVLELIKSSLPFLDFLDLDVDRPEEAHRGLASHYQSRSSVFAAYRQELLSHGRERGWAPTVIDDAIEEALMLDVAFHLLQELVPNALTAATFTTESVYVPHG